MLSSHPKKPFHHKNGSDELDVFQAANYFSSGTENFSGTHRNMRPIRRTSLDMRTEKENENFFPLRSMMTENPTMISGEKKFKKPSSPGGKLAHFLNSLFNQTSLKKSKKKSTNDEDDESPSGWRRKRRSSISHFSSGNSHSSSTAAATTTITTAGCRTPPPSTKTTSYIDLRSYSNLKPPPTQITKIPVTENLNKIKNFNVKSDFPEQNMSFRHGFVEKVKTFDQKQEEDHPYKYVSREDIKEFKKFIDDDDHDSDSSSDLFELTNCDLGCYSSGLPVYETTRMDSIKRASPISSKV